MAVGFSTSLTLLLSLWTSTTSHQIPEGALQMECRDRYFMIAVNLSFTGEEPLFEVVDEGGANPITESYGAQYGYTVSILPAQGLVELRASYFSHHTSSQDDLLFTFSFNLIVSRDGEDVKFPLKKTCSPALAWAPREVTCEANYMEVSVVNNEACPTGTKEDDWDASANMVYRYATSEWQVAMRKPGQETSPMNISEALRRGYAFDLTEGRLVFRTPYGQPESFSAWVNGVPVQVVHAILFSRQGWVIITVDLLAGCSMHEGSHESGYLKWKVPEFLNLNKAQKTKVTVGVNGKLEQTHLGGGGNTVDSAAEQGVYVVEKHNSIFQISIPYNAEGGQRKSLVSDGLHEFYIFNLYVEQILLEGDQVDARLRTFRTLVTPLLPRPLFCENGTLLEERMFLAYLGDVPEDVVLVAVGLNGREFPLQAKNMPGFTITEVVHTNNTRGYTLKVPFDHPVVIQQFSKQDKAMHYILMIQFTLHVLPENEPVYHQTSVTALLDASPPAINASCSDSGIRFTLEHRPFNHLWQLAIGSDLLTSQLAARHGYILSNDSQRLQLDVPLFTTGYKYKNVTLKGFAGTFEVHLQDPKTAEVHSRVTKTCSFSPPQYISCSSNGMMTVVVDLSPMVQSGVDPASTSLLHKNCRPKESDSTRVLYSFPLNSCGNTVKVGKESVTYQNEIFLHSDFQGVENSLDWSDDFMSVVIQCTYPLEGLHRFFWTYMFESETAGVGRILYAKQLREELQTSTTQPTTARRKWSIFLQPSYHLPGRYNKMPNLPKAFLRKGASKVKKWGGVRY